MNPSSAAGRRFAPGWLRRFILLRDGFRCRYCGALLTDETANMDHVVAWPEGLTLLLNLVAACHPCNQAKGTSYVIPRPLRGSPWFRLHRSAKAPEVDERTRRSRRSHALIARIHRRPIRDSWIREGPHAGNL